MAASPLFALSSDAGGSYGAVGVAFSNATALAYDASGSYSIKARPDSTAGINSIAWEIVSADDAHVASLPTVTSSAATKTCTFSVPKQGGAWLLKCTINGGVSATTGDADPALVSSLAIKVLNSAGKQEIAVGETTEAGPYGYTQAWNEVARTVGGGGGSTPTGTGIPHVVAGVQNAAASLIVNADVHASAAIAGSKVAPDFLTQTAKATKFQGTSGVAFNTGLITKSIAAGGTIVLGSGFIECHTIELTGSAASHVLLQFPATVGARWTVRNLSTNNAKYVLLDDGAAGILLPPGASRMVGIGTDGLLFAADGKGAGFEYQARVTGGAIGTQMTELMALPIAYLITEIYTAVITAPSDGASEIAESIGDDSGDPGANISFLVEDSPGTKGIAVASLGTSWADGVILTPGVVVVQHFFEVSVASAAGLVVTVTITGKRLS